MANADLGGARVAVLDGRMSGEMSGLVRRYGGEPAPAPAVRESAMDCSAEVSAFADGVARGAYEVVVFQTGAGARALFEEARKLGRLPQLLAGLGAATTACRGPKPSSALRKAGLHVSVSAGTPYTTRELLAAMADLDLPGRTVMVLHYGERNPDLVSALRERGALVEELTLYEWLLPDDVGPLRAIVPEIVEGRVDAVTFTSQVQARHLFRVAGEMGCEDDLRRALNERVIVASVAPTCADALRALGVAPHVIPEHPKMGHLVRALAEHIGGVQQSHPAREPAHGEGR